MNSFQEHTAEWDQWMGEAPLHFTVPEDFQSEIAKIWPGRARVSLSTQHPETDALAWDLSTQSVARHADGRLLFRPGGHGALLKNLKQVAADTPFLLIRNIDNVVGANLMAKRNEEEERKELKLQRLKEESKKAELEALEGRLAEARLEAAQAAVRLRDHQLRAPSSGIVDEIFVDPGEYVAPGQRLAMFHDPKKLWISANIKETDVAKLALGKKAEVIVDAFPNSPLEATLSRIGSAATSQFALLPNPTPSGNFTTITQRIEVRFELPDTALALKPGMMVELKIAE